MGHVQRMSVALDLVGEKRGRTTKLPDLRVRWEHELLGRKVMDIADPADDQRMERARLPAQDESALAGEVGELAHKVEHPWHAVIEEMSEIAAVERVLDDDDRGLDADVLVTLDRTREAREAAEPQARPEAGSWSW